MKTRDLMIRCLALREGGQWVGICLDFDLASQDESLPAMKAKLEAQIRDYVQDALAGQDRPHAEYLIKRRAPARYWLLYWLAGCINGLQRMRPVKKFQTPVPLVPAAC